MGEAAERQLDLSETDEIKKAIQQEKKAQLTLATVREEQLQGISQYDFKNNPPLAMAHLISKTLRKPDGSLPSLEDSLVLALHWYETKLNPFLGEIFMLPSGRIGKSLQGELKEAKNAGHVLSAPKFTSVEREWPQLNGKPLEMKRKENRADVMFHLPKDIGMRCELTIDGQPIVYEAYFTEWFMPSNHNWWDHKDWMLTIRSFDKALALGTGIAVSQEITANETPGDEKVVTAVVSAPKKIPTL